MTTNKKTDRFIKFVKIAQLKNWLVNIHMGEKMDIKKAATVNVCVPLAYFGSLRKKTF